MDFPKFGLGNFGKFKFLLVIVYLYVLYLLLLGLIGSTSSEAYDPPEVTSASTEKDRAVIMAEGVSHAIEQELDAFFGWLPNDLLFVPNLIDNVTSYQRGVIYATRPASDIIFAYSDDVWGFWFVYDCESKYRAGIKEWREWAESVGTTAKNAGIYNVKSDDVYLILKYCNSMLEYALGNLNKDDIGHFESDNIIYFAKGICAVVENSPLRLSRSFRKRAASASEGSRNPTRGETVKASTAGPSIRQLRLNCWLKRRLQ